MGLLTVLRIRSLLTVLAPPQLLSANPVLVLALVLMLVLALVLVLVTTSAHPLPRLSHPPQQVVVTLLPHPMLQRTSCTCTMPVTTRVVVTAVTAGVALVSPAQRQQCRHQPRLLPVPWCLPLLPPAGCLRAPTPV